MSKFVNYRAIPTLRCFKKCRWCIQGLDVVDWHHTDSEMDVWDVKQSGKALKRNGIKMKRIYLSGGEPALHSNLVAISDALRKYWNPTNDRIRVLTYNKLKHPELLELFPEGRILKSGRFTKRLPFRVSPADLGIEPIFGVNRPCKVQRSCGRSFEHFGFSFCTLANFLGGLLGIDPYKPYPVMMGTNEICQHCLHSLEKRDKVKMHKLIIDGKIPEPTKTYREGIVRWHDDPPRPRTFRERLQIG